MKKQDPEPVSYNDLVRQLDALNASFPADKGRTDIEVITESRAWWNKNWVEYRRITTLLLGMEIARSPGVRLCTIKDIRMVNY